MKSSVMGTHVVPLGKEYGVSGRWRPSKAKKIQTPFQSFVARIVIDSKVSGTTIVTFFCPNIASPA